VENVVGTRHVALAANGAALATQEGAFGTTDAAATRAHRRAFVRVGTRDLTEQYDVAGHDAETYLDAVLGSHPGGTFGNAPGSARGSAPEVPGDAIGPSSTLELSVDATADDAFSDFLAGRDGAALEDVLVDAYTADVRTVVSVRHRDRPGDPGVRPPGPDWVRVDRSVTRSVRVTNASVAPWGSPGDGSVLASATRDVRIQRTHRVTWRRTTETGTSGDNETRTTTATTTERARVAVHVVGRTTLPAAIDRAVTSAFDDRTALVQLNDRPPQHLYPKLDDRGYDYETLERDGATVTVIWEP
jgi:hypothetical protein